MSRAQIEREVGDGLRAMVLAETPQETFSFSIVPSKSIAQGGLDASFNRWRALLVRLRDDHLPQRQPYSDLQIDVILVDKTLNKNLRSARYQITERLVLTQEHAE